ncbi:YhdP family protein [Deefgea rivuli]|uniref:YhdP family protein n=1 Tax=Deefgea rivuli TaxID=400948 RepID=UPI000484C940|nr:YhdP family protein [Deefgea rivuli]
MRRIKLALFHLPTWLFRWLKRIALALALLLAILACAWQFWLVPRLNEYRPLLVEQLQTATGTSVSVGQIMGGWQRLRPQITLTQLQIGENRHAPALVLQKLEGTLSVWAMLTGRLQFHQIRLQAPVLDITRLADGGWRMGGIALSQQKTSDASVLNWFLAQGEIVIERGQLRFRDEQGLYPSLDLTDLNFTTDQFFATHRFELAFTPPVAVGPRIKLQGRFQGRDIAELQQGSGWLKVQVPATNLVRLMPWLSDWWPQYQFESGQGRVDLRLELVNGRLQALEADLGVSDWLVLNKKTSIRYSLPVLNGSFFWTNTPKGTALKIEGRQIISGSGPLCEGCTLNYSQSAKESALALKQWQLSGVNAYLPLLLGAQDALSAEFAQGAFSGLVRSANLSWQGTWPKASKLRTDFDLLNFKVIHPALSVGPLNVEGQWQAAGGRVDLNGQNVLFNYPAQFIDPLILAEAHSRLEWQKKADHWQLDLVNLSLMNAALQLKLSGSYIGPASGEGKVKLAGDIGHLAANQAYRYLPRILGDDVLEWLQQALLAGDASDGKLIWQGDVAGFPYRKGSADEKRGRFAIEANAKDVTLNYVPGWPQIHKIKGKLAFEGLAMDITARSGEISNTQLSDVSVRIPDLMYEQHILVEGKASGQTQDFLQFVASSPVKASTEGFLDTLSAQGAGSLDLKLDMPMDQIEATKVNGRYQFQHNRLDFGGAIPLLQAATGRVEFTEKTLKVPVAQAQALGGTVKLLGSNDPSGALVLALNGDAAMAQIAAEYLPALHNHISGQTNYQARLRIEPKQFDLTLNSDLLGSKVTLPAPMGKNAGEARNLQVKAKGSSQGSAGPQSQLEFTLGDVLAGKMQTSHAGAAPQLRMALALGRDVPALPNNGILIGGYWPQLALEDWLNFAEQLSGKNHAALPPLQVKNLGFAQVNAWGRVLNQVSLSAKPLATAWQFDIDSKEVKGQLNWNSDERRVNAKLEKLWLPLNAPSTVATAVASIDVLQPSRAVLDRVSAFDRPSAWPFVNLEVNDLRYQAVELGQLNVVAAPQAQALAIEQLQLKNSDGVFNLAGAWTQHEGKNMTAGKVELTSPSVGRLLTRFGYPEAMTKAPLHFAGDANWQGVPWSPKLNSLQGQFKIDVGAGRFVQVDPGVGRFLTVLNLQAIPRRLKLDFDDVISQGFAFERITGDAQMEFGVAKTKNLLIDAPSAKVRFQGEANFVAGTQNIVVRIVPAVADTVALGVAVINPIFGLATFAAQKILNQDPIGELVSFEYLIDGAMRDPQVKKLN